MKILTQLFLSQFIAINLFAASPISTTPLTISSSDKTTLSTEPTITETLSDNLFENTKLTASSTLTYQGKKFELKTMGYGLRKKKVFGLVPVKVYVAEFLSANPNLIEKENDKILSSLKKSQAIELKLTMMRDLSGKKISDSFKESLENNDVDIINPSKEITEILKELNSINEFNSSETFSIYCIWKDTIATVFIKKPDGSTKIISGNEKFSTDLFSIWFGKPVDDKLGELKKALLR